MKRTIKCSLAVLLLGSSLYAGGGKNIVPQDVPVAVVPTMLTPTSSNFYIGGGIGIDSISSYLYGPDTAYSAVVKLGYNFMKYLGVEARGTYGISESDQLGHDYSMGLYLKPQYPINDTVTVYGLAGYAQSKISFENEVAFNGISNDTTTQSDFSFGAGLDYDFSDNWSVFIDAVRYIDKETTKPEGKYASKVDSFTLGVTYDF